MTLGSTSAWHEVKNPAANPRELNLSGVSRHGVHRVTRQNAQVREWAKAAGIPVASRGRIPAAVRQRYDAHARRVAGLIDPPLP